MRRIILSRLIFVFLILMNVCVGPINTWGEPVDSSVRGPMNPPLMSGNERGVAATASCGTRYESQIELPYERSEKHHTGIGKYHPKNQE